MLYCIFDNYTGGLDLQGYARFHLYCYGQRSIKVQKIEEINKNHFSLSAFVHSRQLLL
jgi:hypothetical protein